MLESKYIKRILGSFLPNIRINKKIFFPMTEIVFTLENIDSLPSFEGDNSQRGIYDGNESNNMFKLKRNLN